VAQNVLICIEDGPTARQLEAVVDAAGGTYVSLTSFDEVLLKQDRFGFDAVLVAWPNDSLSALRGTLGGHGEEPPLFVALCTHAGAAVDALAAGADDALLLPLAVDTVRVRLHVLSRRMQARRNRRRDVDALSIRLALAHSLMDALPDHAWRIGDDLSLVSLRDDETDPELARAIREAALHQLTLSRDDRKAREILVECNDAGGARRFYDVRITPMGSDVFVLARGVAGTGGSERALARAHDDFKTLIEQAPHGVLLHEHGRVVYVNQRIADIIGVDRDSLIGKPSISFLHPDDQPAAAERVRQFMATQIPPVPREYRAPRANGEVAIVEVNPGAIVEFEGRNVALLMVRDLSETRKMMAKLAMASRMASIGTLAAGVAHELNNPLSFVITNLCVLREELEAVRERLPAETRSEVGEILTDLDTGSLRIRDIVRDLSAWTQVDDPDQSSADLSETVSHCLRMLGDELRGIRVERDLAATSPVVAAPGRVAQIVTNLIGNASHAVREVGAERRVVSVRTIESGNGFVSLEVRDRGPGMDATLTGRIFEPFFTTKPAGSGTGLGLWICHSLISQVGGTIDVQSSPGQGTTFTVRFKAQPVDNGVGHFLVADDEPTLGRALARLLPGSVTVVNSGAELLDRLAEREWVGVFCDLRMPSMDGMEVHGRLLRDHASLADRFVLLVPESDVERVPATLRSLSKPFGRDAITALLAEWGVS
jgi:PAS domain S-box-containing protein